MEPIFTSSTKKRSKLILIGGDGASWIKEGAKNYFPGSIYQLCKFHLERKLKQTLPYHKEMQKEIRNLLKEGEIDKTLKELCQEKSLMQIANEKYTIFQPKSAPLFLKK